MFCDETKLRGEDSDEKNIQKQIAALGFSPDIPGFRVFGWTSVSHQRPTS
jgi:hypothetical protein